MSDIEKLKEIINEIDVLFEHRVIRNDSEFQKWHNKTLRFLHKQYGADSLEYTEFTKMSFTLKVYAGGTERYRFEEKCRKDLYTVKEIFQDYLLELSEENDDASDNNDTEKDIERIFMRFRKVAVQLTRRHSNRETLIIKDEYDVQDLLHGLLKLYFDDVRDEEPIPSYAGGSSRTDFYIPDIKAFIEVKKTRSGLKDKELRDQLIIDIDQYQKHPGCDKIYCFVYDPDTILRNPAAIKKDLEEKHQGLVRVFIES